MYSIMCILYFFLDFSNISDPNLPPPSYEDVTGNMVVSFISRRNTPSYRNSFIISFLHNIASSTPRHVIDLTSVTATALIALLDVNLTTVRPLPPHSSLSLSRHFYYTKEIIIRRKLTNILYNV
jgi:hypothetical protein